MIPAERLLLTPAPETPPGYTTFGLGSERWRILHNLFHVSLATGGTLLAADNAKNFLLAGDLKIAALSAVGAIGLPLIMSFYLTEENTSLPRS